MQTHKPQVNWIIAAILFGGFLATFFLDLTGLELHQWLGLGVGLLATYHLLAHWGWVEAVTRRFLGRTSPEARRFYIVDAGLALGFTAILITGLVISTWLNLSLADYAAWWDIHVEASIFTAVLLAVKLALHWKWILHTARRFVPAPPAVPVPARVRGPASTLTRREFVRLMTVVGAATAVAVYQGVGALREGQVVAEAANGQTVPVSSSSASTSSSRSGATTACTVRCTRGCSYPGHCRRYSDTNGNGRCDQGECV